MYDLTIKRIPFTVDSDSRLRSLKGRTGITPNILCRAGFCLSLEEFGMPKIITPKVEIGREIYLYTLLGQYEILFMALLKTWIQKHKCDFEKIDTYFIAHMNRGVGLLGYKIKSISDIAYLVP